MKGYDTAGLVVRLAGDGVFTRDQAGRLVELLLQTGLIGLGHDALPEFWKPTEPKGAARPFAHLEGRWFHHDTPGSPYTQVMLVPLGMVIRVSGAASEGGALTATFVPCPREDAVRILRENSRKFAELAGSTA